MTDQNWLRDEADTRLEGLFDEDPAVQRAAILEILGNSQQDSELEDLLVETLETSLDEWNDDSSATIWITILIGEMRIDHAVALIERALCSNDELLVAAATRSLRRIGEPAFLHLLDRLDEDSYDEDSFIAAVRTLEAIVMYPELESCRDVIEQQLLGFVRRPQEGRAGAIRAETAALSLAHIGAAEARTDIEKLHNEVYLRRNSFLQEALDVIDEYPNGVPCTSAGSWEKEFKFALDGAEDAELEEEVGFDEEEN